MDGSEGEGEGEFYKLKEVLVQYHCENIGGIPANNFVLINVIHFNKNRLE